MYIKITAGHISGRYDIFDKTSIDICIFRYSGNHYFGKIQN